MPPQHLNPPRTISAAVTAVRGGRALPAADVLAVEAPVEVRVRVGGVDHPLTVTMRTPGNDEELALGLLYSEGLIERAQDVVAVASESADVVVVSLHALPERLAHAQRRVLTTSACGVCGTTSLDALRLPPARPLPAQVRPLPAHVPPLLPVSLRAAQEGFAATGGLHAAALFDHDGQLHLIREDVGRHNAVDKVVGALLQTNRIPLATPDAILMLSGRASFELVQKALRAGIPVVAAVGAPSSLAVSLAVEGGLTLLGFVRDDRFNVYAGAARLAL